jgi:transcriptional regulator with XRE-family HTH domain
MDKSDFNLELEKLGERIKAIRKHRKLTLLDLETLSGINDSDLSRYEQGKENLEFLSIFKIANALKVEINSLFDYDGPLPDNKAFKGLIKKSQNNLSKPKQLSKRKKSH